MKTILISTLLLFSINSLANVAIIEQLRGQVFLGTAKLKEKARIKQAGVLRSESGSFAKIHIPHMASTIVLGPNSKLELKLNKKNNQLTLTDGLARWISNNTKPSLKSKRSISTESAVMGVRGTDFLLVANTLLKETEIVMFEGQVDFKNRADPSDARLLEKNQWGGLGGRFGGEIGKVLTLPPNIIEAFKGKIPKNL
ncbi:MAG: hypothetical protein CME64_18220 [Halobacteriovoraceae bacterium]|nr:hypothetical protein [Halobacteriovoraceae bacterium]|tara:strand:- start:19242 stop:19835 length:594 start_codon:yes stop_codon:yes gene_type:complete